MLLLVALLSLPLAAYAYDFTPPPDPMNACPTLDGFTKRLIVCVRGTILSATKTALLPIFNSLSLLLGACATLAIAIWGFQMATGRWKNALQDGGVLMLKLGVLVVLFGTSAFGMDKLFETALDGMGELLGMVSRSVDFSTAFMATCNLSGSDPSLIIWDRVDCAIDILIGGILSGSTITLGVTGFFLAAMMTNAAGFFIGVTGLLMIVQLLFTVARAVYIFILSYMSLAMMIIVAPLFLPMILFSFTRGYFDKWLRLTLGFLIQPIFIFVFLAMMLAAFDTVVYTGPQSLYNTITPNLFPAGQSIYTRSAGEYLMAGGYREGTKGNAAINLNVAHSAPTVGGRLDLTNRETGLTGKLSETTTTRAQFEQVGKVAGVDRIHQLLGRSATQPQGIDPFFAHIQIPVTQVDWEELQMDIRPTCVPTPPHNDCVVDYLIDVMLSVIMALVTAYIFLQLLNSLPFIGSGVASDPASGSGFGFGSLGPPGEGMINWVQKKLKG